MTGSSRDQELAELEDEVRRRFSWLSMLHEHLAACRTAEAPKVLEIARRRWLEAREALRRRRAAD
ncbi:MAG: hypothetical protein JSR47_23665 [Proteobacteria bacterium]|nr:hypothetical protein [Pseudomonadota bacterium]